MLLEAPRNDALDFFPRLAAKAAPAAICCFLDFAGMSLITPNQCNPATSWAPGKRLIQRCRRSPGLGRACSVSLCLRSGGTTALRALPPVQCAHVTVGTRGERCVRRSFIC